MKKEILLRQELLQKVLALAPVEEHETVREKINLLNKLVNQIENRPATTMDHYGDYLCVVDSEFAGIMLIVAGANINGVKWALKLNGLESASRN